ncbi:hypothetical protein HDU97_004285 [Phlyctochytrium planicorne]|nr:hypothetical protein HDU97_004285 [Phlyctochytrium planicorne]
MTTGALPKSPGGSKSAILTAIDVKHFAHNPSNHTTSNGPLRRPFQSSTTQLLLLVFVICLLFIFSSAYLLSFKGVTLSSLSSLSSQLASPIPPASPDLLDDSLAGPPDDFLSS